jgi:preprotein translocase subunit YajC
LALVPIILLFAVMYLLVIRPQQRRVRDHAVFVTSLHYGEEVVTAGGIFGTITGLTDDVVTLEVAPGVAVKVLRSSITRRIDEDEPEEEPAADELDVPNDIGTIDEARPEATPDAASDTAPDGD